VGRRLILDTCVLIDVEQGRLILSDHIRDDDDVAIAAITAAELWEGYVRANDARRADRRAFAEDVFDRMPIEDYTLDTALKHGELLGYCAVTGRPRGRHDLIIAATAAMGRRAIMTRDAKAIFHGLPGVEVEVLEAHGR
jgi:tRNA(fMet)-specific endonuclease VapC